MSNIAMSKEEMKEAFDVEVAVNNARVSTTVNGIRSIVRSTAVLSNIAAMLGGFRVLDMQHTDHFEVVLPENQYGLHAMRFGYACKGLPVTAVYHISPDSAEGFEGQLQRIGVAKFEKREEIGGQVITYTAYMTHEAAEAMLFSIHGGMEEAIAKYEKEKAEREQHGDEAAPVADLVDGEAE